MRFRKLRIAWSAIGVVLFGYLSAYCHRLNFDPLHGQWYWGAGAIVFAFLAVLALAIMARMLSGWIQWSRRFSLRTLLIAMTLVAVALGLVVSAANR
jgi:arginine exporter protein ArgO